MKIDKININEIFNNPKNYRCIIYGSTDTGKSYYLANMIYPEIKDLFHKIFVFSKTSNKGFYEKHYGKNILFFTNKSEFKNLITKIRNKQTDKKNIKGVDEEGNPIYKKRLLFIFDDVISEKLVKSEEFGDLFTNGRHDAITTFFLIQTCSVVVSTLMKNNVEISVICRFLNRNMKNRITMDLIDPIDYYYTNKGKNISEKELRIKTNKIYNKIVLNQEYGKIILCHKKCVIYYDSKDKDN